MYLCQFQGPCMCLTVVASWDILMDLSHYELNSTCVFHSKTNRNICCAKGK